MGKQGAYTVSGRRWPVLSINVWRFSPTHHLVNGFKSQQPSFSDSSHTFWTQRATKMRAARPLISENKDHLDMCPVSPCLVSPSVFIRNYEKLKHLRPDSAAGIFTGVLTLTWDKCNYKSRCCIKRLNPGNDNSCWLDADSCYCLQAATQHGEN